jgi:GNAT superfamily N-acetyltransferase
MEPVAQDSSREHERLRALYDSQLRTDAETYGAITVKRHGSLLLATLANGNGLVTYRDLEGASEGTIRRIVSVVLAYYEDSTVTNSVEWKTRRHDEAPGLREALLNNGFVPDEEESIMIGQAKALAVDVPLPGGVTLRQVTAENDVRAMSAMQDEVFGRSSSSETAKALLRRLSRGEVMELWVAEAEGRIVTGGRLEPIPGSDFAGIWGGATLKEWRGLGIYRALTAARARSALRIGKTLIHSDSTTYSRRILERFGFVEVSTTTPYRWTRLPANRR